MPRSVCLLPLLLMFTFSLTMADEPLRVGTFNVDATPPLGAQMAYSLARSVDDPLSARGIVLLGGPQPIVLCAVDWIGIGNGGHDAWREALAQAAGTSREHVCVHTLHQHDAPPCDFTAEGLLAEQGLDGKMFDVPFANRTIERVAQAVRRAVAEAQPVTHLGLGKAKVDRVASNRRILGEDGRVQYVRFSSSRIPEAIAAPEGTIDPYVKLISFWNGEQPIASLTYYATHPQSYYGQGDVSADFVGLARAQRETEQSDVAHIHFNGAGGNIAAGKYNDGSPARRPELSGRLAAGMAAAWQAQKRVPIASADLEWRVKPVLLPVRETLDIDRLRSVLADSSADAKDRITAARNLAFAQRMNDQQPIDLTCLRLGNAYVVHMPGELFVEYQLAAQEMLADKLVCMAAYGDYGPGYIGTEISYNQGGYETGTPSRTAPQVEAVLLAALRELLE